MIEWAPVIMLISGFSPMLLLAILAWLMVLEGELKRLSTTFGIQASVAHAGTRTYA
jgi:hypothetical protein